MFASRRFMGGADQAFLIDAPYMGADGSLLQTRTRPADSGAASRVNWVSIGPKIAGLCRAVPGSATCSRRFPTGGRSGSADIKVHPRSGGCGETRAPVGGARL